MLMTAVAMLSLTASVAVADEARINLEWRPAESVVQIGEDVSLGLWAYTDEEELQLFRALDMVFEWDAEYLDLLGLNAAGAVGLLSSGFPSDDPYGLNESSPPGDGDGFYSAWAPLGTPIEVSPTGVLLTTFEFTALAESEAAGVAIVAAGGAPVLETTVWGGTDANTDVTGMLGDAVVRIIPEPSMLVLVLTGGWLCRRSARG